MATRLWNSARYWNPMCCVLQEQLPLTSTEALCRKKDSSKEGSGDLSLGNQKYSSSEVAKVMTSPKMQETLLNVCLTGIC